MYLVQGELYEARTFFNEICTQIEEAGHCRELCEQRVQRAGSQIQQTHERALELVGKIPS
jgi:hypothetical protein